MNEMVNIEGIKSIAKKISSYQNELSEIYNSRLIPLLNECRPIFEENGISYDYELSKYRKIYNELNNKLLNYSNLLSKEVVGQYNQTKENINNLFNYDLKQKIDQINENK